MTFGQLGVVDATAFAFGLFMEIPSGAVSDLIGKRKTIIWAMGLAMVGTMIMAFSSSLHMLWAAFFLAQLGWAFYSGAAEALAYDSLLELKKEAEYDKVASATSSLSSLASILATLLGGLLYSWWFRSTHLFWSLGYLLAFLISFKLVEPKIDSIKFSLSNYFSQLIIGVKQLLKPALVPYFLIILALMGSSYLYDWGLVKPTMAKEFGFLSGTQAIIFAAFSALGAILVTLTPHLRRLVSDKKGLYLLALIMGLGFVLAFFKLGIYGLFPMLLISLSGQLAYPWVSTVVNDELDSKYRATALSTVTLLTKLPYTLLAILAGNMAQSGSFNIFNLGIGIAIIFTTFAGIVLSKIRK